MSISPLDYIGITVILNIRIHTSIFKQQLVIIFKIPAQICKITRIAIIMFELVVSAKEFFFSNTLAALKEIFIYSHCNILANYKDNIIIIQSYIKLKVC